MPRRQSRQVKATVSGSFRRHMDGVQQAVDALSEAGVEVISPADPTVVDAFGDFVFVASDALRAVRVVQSRHLSAIDESDFLWLVAPDGYVGPSAAMELGYAVARGVPVYSVTPPDDLTMRQFVTVIADLREAVSRCSSTPTTRARSVLVDPLVGLEVGHAQLETIGKLLTTRDPEHRFEIPALAKAAAELRATVRNL